MEYDIKSGVKGLIFDLDGTLVDSMPIHYEGWRKAAGKFGTDIEPEFLKKFTGSPGWAIAAKILERSGLENEVTVEQVMKVKIEEFFRDQHLIKPIEPVIAIAKKYHGILPMAIGTGGVREAVEKTLEMTDLKKYFNIIVTANDVTNHKPHPETFIRCAEMMGIAPGLIEVFEDGELGMEAAISAGMIVTDVRTWYTSNW